VESIFNMELLGQREPAPTNAPMWMDGAMMGAPFSSLLVLGLTKVVNSNCPIFSFPQPKVFFLGTFFSSPPTFAQVSPTYLHLDYLPMHLGLFLPRPTYLSIDLLTHLSTYPPICLPFHQPTYLCTYTLNHHQGNDGAC
jgi:hypothetical protein